MRRRNSPASGQMTSWGAASQSRVWPTSSERNPGLSEASREQRARSRFYPAWAALQNENAALSASSVHIVAQSAGHHVQRDDPELVNSAIADLVQRTRARTSSRPCGVTRPSSSSSSRRRVRQP